MVFYVPYRAGIAPFTCARKVLEPLKDSGSSPQPDFLQLCHDVPMEVVELKVGENVTTRPEPIYMTVLCSKICPIMLFGNATNITLLCSARYMPLFN